ncbi:hypothetical protein V5P93_005096 [Actinokineospora auranticolor]|uniref:Uncharacterized protein n=1 Tax=Actinokineospora auranticolor TaxID=155976 RepID=A0A2S6GKE7_9PSEU|nr:hypothetical protein [Actinokineospora auranticolor]PPK65626.1 hypothetical protein CLV40_113110 [Actinokineospora auranticolor]
MSTPEHPDSPLARAPGDGTAMRAAITGVVKLIDHVRADRTAIDPGSGARLLVALRELRDEAVGWQTRAVPVGADDAGRRAENDDLTFAVVLDGYVDALGTAIDTVSAAMAAHRSAGPR